MDEKVTIRFTADDMEKLKKIAEAKGITVTEVVRELVQNQSNTPSNKEESKGVEPLNTEDMKKIVSWYQRTEAKINLMGRKIDDMVFVSAVLVAQFHESGNVIKEKREDIFNRLSNIVKNVK